MPPNFTEVDGVNCWLLAAAHPPPPATDSPFQPRWRRDGRELYYVAPDARLMVVPIRLVPNTHTLEAGTPAALFPTRLAAGGNISGTGFLARAQYAVAPDGRFLLNMAADDAVTSPITIVQNWTVGLKR